MGKDKEGKFHPKKGKPSTAVEQAESGLKDIDTSAIKNYLEIAEKYTVGEEEPAPNVRVRHPNRNVDKREERTQDKKDNNNDKTQSYKSKTEQSVSTTIKSDASIEELPSFIGKDQLAVLAGIKSDHCISIYMETHQSGMEKNEQKDTIAFKNLLQQITYQLRKRDANQAVIEKLLMPGYDLLRNDQFWLSQKKGLAVFISEGELKFAKLPYAPKDEIHINNSYYLTPLMPVAVGRDYFYLLVLSKKQAKLYRADEFGMSYIDVPELPNGVEDVVHFEEKDDQKLFRTDTAGAGQGANYHGIGSGKPDDKQNIAMYFDEVDETLWTEVLKNENAPLLLAGVEYLIPIYKSVAKYKPIREEALTGSHEHDDIESLHRQAYEIMKPYFLERSKKALDMYGNQSATALTSSIEADVIPAAHYRRVWHLFVKKGEHIWGKFDEMENKLEIHEQEQQDDEDLIDKSILKTILNGGEVHLLDAERMPADCKIAALMRYEA